MTRAELARAIYDISHLTGTFKLRSGTTSNEYFDKYRFEANPRILEAIAEQLVPLIPPGTEVLAGLEMGGIPIATALSLKSGLPCAFVRKTAKDYGTCQFSEGTEVKNKNVLIIEDVVTTGGQVALSCEDLRSLGAVVNHVLCVIHRGTLPEPKLAEKKLTLFPLFSMAELKASTSK